MKKTIKMCAPVQDLFPSYIDGLTSEETKGWIEEHLAECEGCRQVLADMKAGSEAEGPAAQADKKEIDFLKKNRSRNRLAVIGGMLAVLALAAMVLAIRFFVIGSEYRGTMYQEVRAEGNHLVVEAEVFDSATVLKGIDFTMEDGVVRGRVITVLPSVFNDGSGRITEDVTFQEEDIREVWIGDRLCWMDGVQISEMESEVYKAGHDYIGDMPANGALMSALRFSDQFGSFTHELQTEEEPYVWTIVFEEDLSKYSAAYLEDRLEKYGYVMLGSVGNLGEAEFRYTYEGEAMTKKITAEEASAYFGKDIKTVRQSAAALHELMEKAEIR